MNERNKIRYIVAGGLLLSATAAGAYALGGSRSNNETSDTKPTTAPTSTEPSNDQINKYLTSVALTPSLTPEPPQQKENILGVKDKTRYQARALFALDGGVHALNVPDQNKPRTVDQQGLMKVRDALVSDINTLVSLQNGTIKIEQFGDWAELFLEGQGRLGVTPGGVIDGLNNAHFLMGRVDSAGNLIWDITGDSVVGLANSYDPNKKEQTQVLTGVMHAREAWQVFRAMAVSISIATRRDVDYLQAQIAKNVGYKAINPQGTEFIIDCWRTFDGKTQNPVWGNFNFQQAHYKDGVGVGNAHEEDGVEDGSGTMVVDPNETVFVVIKVGPNGVISGDDVTDTSTTIVDSNGQRDASHGNGDNWKPCKPKVNVNAPVKQQPPVVPVQVNPPKENTPQPPQPTPQTQQKGPDPFSNGTNNGSDMGGRIDRGTGGGAANADASVPSGSLSQTGTNEH